MSFKVMPYKPASESAKVLAEGLGVKRLKHEGSRYKGREGDVVINWGSTKGELFEGLVGAVRVLNPPAVVARAINKLSAFERMAELDVPIPPFTEDKANAAEMIGQGRTVVCRTNLTGYGGAGIVIAETVEQLVDAPLYVRYMPKEQEYRIHVMSGKAFFSQRKARSHDVPDEDVNWKVRNLAGGFIYANVDVTPPGEATDAAVDAVAALGLDFGAVDVIVSARGKVFVLEINTACGLAGTTLTKYVEEFNNSF